MKVGIDGRAFDSPAAGVRRYLEGLVPALLALPQAPELVVLGGTAAPHGLRHEPEPLHLPTNPGWALTGLPRAASRAGVDLIHAPAYTAPLTSSIPVVLTIHDVSYERRPEFYPYRRDALRRAFYRRSARAASRILTDSEFSAGEIAAAYGIDRTNITVAPLGVTSTFAPSHPPSLPSGATADKPSDPFVLHVGDLHERRNLPMVLRAVLQLRSRGTSVSLVTAGVDRGVGPALDDLARAAGDADAIRQLGRVDEEQLLTLYRTASALVYPSRYEGFGFPVLEAMATGTPVIASSAGSIPEVLGAAGILLDPDDAGAWAEAIAGVVADGERRESMRVRGLARAATFTWERTAQITLAVYRQALAR